MHVHCDRPGRAIVNQLERALQLTRTRYRIIHHASFINHSLDLDTSDMHAIYMCTVTPRLERSSSQANLKLHRQHGSSRHSWRRHWLRRGDGRDAEIFAGAQRIRVDHPSS